jgi:hypothetical protein
MNGTTNHQPLTKQTLANERPEQPYPEVPGWYLCASTQGQMKPTGRLCEYSEYQLSHVCAISPLVELPFESEPQLCNALQFQGCHTKNDICA